MPATGSTAVELQRSQFAGIEPVAVLTGRNRTKADVAIYLIEGRRVALKTYAARPWWIRHTLGRWTTRREAAAYRAAMGVDGIVTFLGRPDRYSLATEWIDGKSLPELDMTRIDDRVFDAVNATLERLHERGIALGDLHHRNVVLAQDGRTYVLDLAGAWLLERKAGWLKRRFFQRIKDLDHLALARMRARWTGGDTERAVAGFGGPIADWHRRGRALKRIVNALRGKKRAARPARRQETSCSDE